MVASSEDISPSQGDTPQPEFKDQNQMPPGGDTPAPVAPKTTAPKNPYQSANFTGYGPLEGKRWLKEQSMAQFAAMSIASDNPGLYVRQKFDMDKRIEGFDQNLSLEDAAHVWENVFSPQFDSLKIKGIENEYDSRGKALLDQIYAPIGHGDTKPRWDQIPKNERIASAAYAVVAALTGHGDRALTALARPLTLQEEENVKKEQERQQNEEVRRQGLVEQFNVLMGNKKTEVAAVEQRQREDAISRRGEIKQTFEEKKQHDVNAKNAQAELDKFKDSDTVAKKGALAQFEARMRELNQDPNYEAPKELKDWANTPSSQEKARNALTQARVDRDEQFKKEAQPKLDILNQRLINMKKTGELDDQRLSDLKYKAENITPWVAKNQREHYTKQLLDVEKLEHAKLNGWVSSAKGTTLLRDAHGNLILDAGGRPIKTLAEARAKVSDIDALLHQQTSELGQDLARAGATAEGAANLQGMIRDGIQQGKSVKQIEDLMNTVMGPFGGGIDKSLISRAIAIEKARDTNQKLREKLGEADAEPASPTAPFQPAISGPISGGSIDLGGGVTAKRIK